MITNHLQMLPNDVVGIIKKLVEPDKVYNLIYEDYDAAEEDDDIDVHNSVIEATYLSLNLAIKGMLELYNTNILNNKNNYINDGWIYADNIGAYTEGNLRINEIIVNCHWDGPLIYYRLNIDNDNYRITKHVNLLINAYPNATRDLIANWKYEPTKEFKSFDFLRYIAHQKTLKTLWESDEALDELEE
jgi:hypothetical protein